MIWRRLQRSAWTLLAALAPMAAAAECAELDSKERVDAEGGDEAVGARLGRWGTWAQAGLRPCKMAALRQSFRLWWKARVNRSPCGMPQHPKCPRLSSLRHQNLWTVDPRQD